MVKKKYYVVWKGLIPGVYDSWEDCMIQIKGFAGAIYKSFPAKDIALQAYEDDYRNHIGRNTQVILSDEEKELTGRPLSDSICVDAACSGNPGLLEYRGVDTKTGVELFKEGPYADGTQNIGEFLAIVHGLAYLKKKKHTIPVYSDSRTAIKWVKDKNVKTKLTMTPGNRILFNLIDRAILWLKNNEYPNKILKWETTVWGEIPADFARK